MSRSFEQIIEQHVAGAAARSEDVGVIVLSFGAEPRGAETTLSWIGNTAACSGPTDLVGRLSSGDIGVLLPDTPHKAPRSSWRGSGLVEAPKAPALLAVRVVRDGQPRGRFAAPALLVGSAGQSRHGPSTTVVTPALSPVHGTAHPARLLRFPPHENLRTPISDASNLCRRSLLARLAGRPSCVQEAAHGNSAARRQRRLSLRRSKSPGKWT